MIISSVLFSVLLSVNLTSFSNLLMIPRIAFLLGFLLNHHFFLKARGKAKRINHDIDNVEDLGSNTENRFVIIL
jgi:hypothetical protein